ncbi:MAG: GtrA family protein [Bacilli bacterium]|nr:GtrA family protein [Bacilli bacterium]
MINKIKELYKKYEEIISYLIFGILTTVISFASYLIFANIFFPNKTDLDIQIANILSWVCAVTFAYITNRIWVFKSKTKGKKQLREIVEFVSARIASLLVDMGMMYVMYSLMHMNDTIAKLIVQFVIVAMNYILSKLIIFKKKN